MKCQGKRWSLSWMRSWNCGLIQYPLLMKYSLLFGTILELCLWVILIEIAQCCEAGDWSRAWIPVVLGSGWQGPVQSFLSEVSFMTFPPRACDSLGFWFLRSSLIVTHSFQGHCWEPRRIWELGPSASPISSFPSLYFLSLHPLSPLRKKEQPKPN